MKLVHCNIVALVVSAAGVGALDTYPTSYPFENEINPPEAPGAATPTYAFTEDDPGGYGYTLQYKFVVTNDVLPLSSWSVGTNSWYAAVIMKWPPMVAQSFFNCTLHSVDEETGEVRKFKADTLVGNAGPNFFYCEEGECCKEYVDVVISRRSNKQEDFVAAHERKKTFFEGGLCTEPYHEAIYCVTMIDGYVGWCFEQIISETERTIIAPCYDMYYNYIFEKCKLYVVTGSYTDGESEPFNYYARGTVGSNEAAMLMHQPFSDKLCRPTSYYYPEKAKNYIGETQESKDESSSSLLHLIYLISFVTFFL